MGSQESRTTVRFLEKNSVKARSCEKAWSCLWNGEKFFVMYYMDSRVEGKTGNKGKILKGCYDILYTTAFPLILCSLKE